MTGFMLWVAYQLGKSAPKDPGRVWEGAEVCPRCKGRCLNKLHCDVKVESLKLGPPSARKLAADKASFDEFIQREADRAEAELSPVQLGRRLDSKQKTMTKSVALDIIGHLDSFNQREHNDTDEIGSIALRYSTTRAEAEKMIERAKEKI